MCLYRFNESHLSNICSEIKTVVFILNSPKSDNRSLKSAWRPLQLTLSYYDEMVIMVIEDWTKEFNGTGHRMIAAPRSLDTQDFLVRLFFPEISVVNIFG